MISNGAWHSLCVDFANIFIIIIIIIIIMIVIIIIQYITEDNHSNNCIVMYQRYKHVGCHSEPV